MRARLHGFVDALRADGIALSVVERIDAMHAVGVAGVERGVLREALAATLIKDERDRGTFDVLFERYFPLPPPAAPEHRTRRGRSPRGTPGAERGRGGASEATGASAARPGPGANGRSAGRSEPVRPGSRGARGRDPRQARFSELRRQPFRELTTDDVGELRELVALLAEQLRRRLARRWRTARRGTLELRRTLRAATATAGVPLRLARRRRRPAKPDLVALCDVSGSVAAASELLLALIAPASVFFRRVRLYVYVDHLCPVSIEHGRLVPERPLDLHARSDFGQVLGELRTEPPRLSPTTLALVLGDARNNRRPPRADLLRGVRAQVQRLVWMVSEPRTRWGTGDSALAAYAPWCDAVVECVDLDGLVRAVRQALD